jgi:hypothetical protein
MSYKNLTVDFDGYRIGVVSDARQLKQGLSFWLPDGTNLGVKLMQRPFPELHLIRNGLPVPGSDADPYTRLKTPAIVLFVIGALNILLGILAFLIKDSVLEALGVNIISAAIGLVFVLLGFFVLRGSMIALGLGFALLVVDLILSVVLIAGSGRGISFGGIAIRILFLLALAQGFTAIIDLQKMKATGIGRQ